jgi:hypothetical protein
MSAGVTFSGSTKRVGTVMNNIVNAIPHRAAGRQKPDGLDLLLLAACVLAEADPVVGLAMKAGLYLWRRHLR